VFLDYLLNGLGLGAIFAFIALGYTMVYGIIKLINFAHGEFVMVGAFAGYFVLRDAGVERVRLPQPLPMVLAFVVALTAASLASGLLAVVVERLAYRPVRRAGRIAALLTAVGVSLLLQNVAQQVWGAKKHPYPDAREWVDVAALEGPASSTLWLPDEPGAVAQEGQVLDEAWKASLLARGRDRVYRRVTLSVRENQALVLVALALWAPALWFLVKRTRTGKAMRAVSEDMETARLMGIPIDRVVAATFFLGAFVGGVGGVALGTTYGTVDYQMGFLPGMKAFVAAVIGGIGSIPGAIVGGLILGLVESILPWGLEQLGWAEARAWKDAIAFAVLIVVLLVKPTGLLGKPVREKV
jgi:branched-chain amino acid transport system permease protein